MINWWNVWQHWKKRAKSGNRADLWAFNFIRGFMPEDKLRLHESRV